MYKAVNKNKVIQRYMEALTIYNGSPTVHWQDKISCIYVVGYKIVNPRVKHMYITVYFLQENFDNGLFIPKYEKYSVMLEDMCTKLCSGPNYNWT